MMDLQADFLTFTFARLTQVPIAPQHILAGVEEVRLRPVLIAYALHLWLDQFVRVEIA